MIVFRTMFEGKIFTRLELSCTQDQLLEALAKNARNDNGLKYSTYGKRIFHSVVFPDGRIYCADGNKYKRNPKDNSKVWYVKYWYNLLLKGEFSNGKKENAKSGEEMASSATRYQEVSSTNLNK